VRLDVPVPHIKLDVVQNARQVGLAVLAALILHALVFAGFHASSPNLPELQNQTIDVSLDAPAIYTPPAPRQPEKQPPLPKPQPTPEPEPAKDAPAPEVAETPPPPAPTPAPSNAAPAPSNTPPSEEIQPLFKLTRMPSFARKIEAAYPATERRAGVQANVLAEVTINSQGNVLSVRILKSGGPTFDEAVKEALQKSTFNPGVIDGKPVGTRFQVPFRFNLN